MFFKFKKCHIEDKGSVKEKYTYSDSHADTKESLISAHKSLGYELSDIVEQSVPEDILCTMNSQSLPIVDENTKVAAETILKGFFHENNKTLTEIPLESSESVWSFAKRKEDNLKRLLEDIDTKPSGLSSLPQHIEANLKEILSDNTLNFYYKMLLLLRMIKLNQVDGVVVDNVLIKKVTEEEKQEEIVKFEAKKILKDFETDKQETTLTFLPSDKIHEKLKIVDGKMIEV